MAEAEFIVSGSFDDTVRKIDQNGNEIWNYNVGDAVGDVYVDTQDFVYVGSYNNNLIKLNQNGNLVWTFTGHTDVVQAIVVDNNGNVYSGSRDDTVRKIDSSGNQVWSFTNHTNDVQSLVLDSNGFIYSGSIDNTVRKIDSNGNQIWSYTTPNSGVQDLSIDENNNIYVAAVLDAIKLDSSGNEIWASPNPSSQIFISVAVDTNGNVYLGTNDEYLVKFDLNGQLVFNNRIGNGLGALNTIKIDTSNFIYLGYASSDVIKYDSNLNLIWTFTNHIFAVSSLDNSKILPSSPIKLGETNIFDIYKGSTLVDRAYKGGTLFFGEPPVPTILGVEWNQSTDSLTRLDDSVGLTAGSNFNDFNPYKLRRCMVNDDLSINYYIDSDNPNLIGEVVNTGSYTTGGTANYTGSHGQVMVEIPKFWWKTDEPSTGQYQWRIAVDEFDGYNVHPAFITNGVTKDYIYMSAFEAGLDGTKLTSVSGVQPDVDKTIDTFRTYSQNRGTGWQQQTYWGTHSLQLLYLIEYADFNSQTTIGRGVADYDLYAAGTPLNTGDTISLGNASGAASGTDGFSSISYRGVENIYGNVPSFIDGLNLKEKEIFVANENFETIQVGGLVPSGYTSVGFIDLSPSSFSDYVTNINFPHFLASAGGGSSTTFIPDRQGGNTGERISTYGARWSSQDSVGIFNFLAGTSPTYSDFVQGARLQIL